MKKRIKKLFKEIVIIWAVICTLLPTIFTGFVAAASQGTLNTERAGNYVANFAINFYENWSSVNEDLYNKSQVVASGAILENADMIWQRVKKDNPSYGNTNPSPQTIVDDEDTRIQTIDCSGFVACVIYATTGDDKFKSSFNCGMLYGQFIDQNEREKYAGLGWEIKTNKECIQSRRYGTSSR